MRRALLFAALTVTVVVLLAWVGTRFATDPAAQQAIWLSAGIAIGIQLVGFVFATVLAPAHMMAGWGAAILLRFVALAFHALLGTKLMGLPAAPSLLSLAGFLFVTTLYEPLFLAPQHAPKPQ